MARQALLDFDADATFFLSDAHNFTDFFLSLSPNETKNLTEGVLNFFDEFDTLPIGAYDVDSTNETLPTRMVKFLETYMVPVIGIVGLLGNLLSFVVFVATYMGRLSSSLYLAALSLVDMIFLGLVLYSWSVSMGGISMEHGCQIFTYLTYVSSFLSVWYVVSFTVERYIAVHYPLRRFEFCTTSRAQCVVIGLASFAALLYSFGTWTSGINYHLGIPFCGPLQKFLHIVQVIDNIDTVITLILPFIAILFMNVRIAHKVRIFYRKRRTITEQAVMLSRDSDSGTQGSARLRVTVPAVSKAGYLRNQVRVTKMLLIVSSIFLLLNLPRHTQRVYMFLYQLSHPNTFPSTNFIFWQRIFDFLYYLHFCVNVFLYSALGANFRKAFFCLVRRIKHSLAGMTCTMKNPCRARQQTTSAQVNINTNSYSLRTVEQRRQNCRMQLQPNPCSIQTSRCPKARTMTTHCFAPGHQ